ncbi:MAG: protein kinase domain-containing protein, partial [Sphingomicrobium sp.]
MTTSFDRLRTAIASRYEIERELGHGAMATVYLARDLKHDRQVAVKVMRDDVGFAMGAERFKREIELVTHLSHPHILPIYDSGAADGELFYVMPYIEGESLRARL